MNAIFKIAVEKVKQFEILKNSSQNDLKSSEDISDENYENLVVEIAETLTRFTIALKNNIKEVDLFIL